MFSDRQFVVSGDEHSPYIEAIVEFDLAGAQALFDALSHAVRRLAAAELDTQDVLRLRALDDMQDQLARGIAEGAPVGRLTFAAAQTLTEVVGAYLQERDVESYQSPEERMRIAELRELSGPLFDLTAECFAAAAELQARIDEGLPVFAVRR